MTRRLHRRELTLGLVAMSAMTLACQKRSEASPTPPQERPAPPPPAVQPETGTRGATQVLDWSFEGPVSSRTAVVVPSWGAGERFPVLIALHGRGEARKPPAI